MILILSPEYLNRQQNQDVTENTSKLRHPKKVPIPYQEFWHSFGNFLVGSWKYKSNEIYSR